MKNKWLNLCMGIWIGTFALSIVGCFVISDIKNNQHEQTILTYEYSTFYGHYLNDEIGEVFVSNSDLKGIFDKGQKFKATFDKENDHELIDLELVK